MPRRLAVLVVLLLSTTLLHASQESGIIITFGAFQIAVLYDDVVESPPSIWIRDPQYVLLDLLRFLKANENALFSRRAMIDVDLYEDRLTISESYYRKGILSGKTILEKHVTGNFSSDITDVLCDQLRRSDGECFPAGPEVKVRLYRCCGEEG